MFPFQNTFRVINFTTIRPIRAVPKCILGLKHNENASYKYITWMNEGCRKCKTTLAPLQSRYCAVMSGDTLKYRNKYRTLRVFNFKLSWLLQGRVHDKLLVVFLRHHDGPPDYRCMMMNTHSQCLCWSDYWTLNPYVAVMRKLILKISLCHSQDPALYHISYMEMADEKTYFVCRNVIAIAY